MDKKMTSGEIAKKAGITQKAIRLYDEKGLLKPSEYSEGNYRLYDNEALLVLEKIIALKHIGFSLEEIHDNLIAEKNMDIKETLNRQLELMEEKKAEIDRTISCIKSVLSRTGGQPDWNSVAEITRMIQKDQGADEHHFDALKHTADNMDWYVKIYDSLKIKKDSRILDLGCGYGKLWRNNWSELPTDVKIKGVDLHGSWADDFAAFIEERKSELAENTDIHILWGDAEDKATWNEISEDKSYDCVIAHYLMSFIGDKETFIQQVSSVIKEGGMFSCNGYYVSPEEQFWKEMLEDMGLSVSFIEKRIIEGSKNQDEFETLLEKHFDKVEIVNLVNKMRYTCSEELFAGLCERYPEMKKCFNDNANRIKHHFDKIIADDGEIVFEAESAFWHCFK